MLVRGLNTCMGPAALAVGLLMSGCDEAPAPAAASPAPAATDSGGVEEAGAHADASPAPGFPDADRDGLCDHTESEHRTSPDRLDTDADGFPDLIEVEYGFAPLEPDSPALNQVVFLREARGSSADMLVNIWVDGEGMSHTGTFQSIEPLASQNLSAADLYVGAVALSAEPPDQAFGIEPDAARFGAVHGMTRLSFDLFFAFGDSPAAGCIQGCPFFFGVKRPDDRVLGRRRLMVVTVPPDEEPAAPLWCLPRECR